MYVHVDAHMMVDLDRLSVEFTVSDQEETSNVGKPGSLERAQSISERERDSHTQVAIQDSRSIIVQARLEKLLGVRNMEGYIRLIVRMSS